MAHEWDDWGPVSKRPRTDGGKGYDGGFGKGWDGWDDFGKGALVWGKDGAKVWDMPCDKGWGEMDFGKGDIDADKRGVSSKTSKGSKSSKSSSSSKSLEKDAGKGSKARGLDAGNGWDLNGGTGYEMDDGKSWEMDFGKGWDIDGGKGWAMLGGKGWDMNGGKGWIMDGGSGWDGMVKGKGKIAYDGGWDESWDGHGWWDAWMSGMSYAWSMMKGYGPYGVGMKGAWGKGPWEERGKGKDMLEDLESKGKGKLEDSKARGGPDDKAYCELHNKMRKKDLLTRDPVTGAFHCREGFECRDNTSGEPCKFFREGRCQRGDKCVFSHEGEGAVEEFIWSPSNPKLGFCALHQKQRHNNALVMDSDTGVMVCREGDECKGAANTPCVFYQQGKCKRGSDCRYLHEE